MHEGILIRSSCREFVHDASKLKGVATFEKVKAEKDAKGRAPLDATGEPDVLMECDGMLVAV